MSLEEEIVCPETIEDIAGFNSDVQSALNTASKDKFLLVLTIPKILRPYQQTFVRDQDKIDSDTLMYKIYGLNIPKISVPSLKPKVAGFPIKVSSHVKEDYGTTKVDFVVDSLFSNYHFLYKWLDVLADDQGQGYDGKNLRPSSKGRLNEYSTTITVFGLDEYNRMVAEFQFKGAFITSLAGIEYNYQNDKEIQSSFEFDYTYYSMNLIEEPTTIHTI